MALNHELIATSLTEALRINKSGTSLVITGLTASGKSQLLLKLHNKIPASALIDIESVVPAVALEALVGSIEFIQSGITLIIDNIEAAHVPTIMDEPIIGYRSRLMTRLMLSAARRDVRLILAVTAYHSPDPIEIKPHCDSAWRRLKTPIINLSQKS